jgi:hypothetical protein
MRESDLAGPKKARGMHSMPDRLEAGLRRIAHEFHERHVVCSCFRFTIDFEVIRLATKPGSEHSPLARVKSAIAPASGRREPAGMNTLREKLEF